MDILFHVTTEGGAQLLAPLARACRRGGHAFGAFFTHEGVRGLRDAGLQAALAEARAARVVVCEESWHRFCADAACPVELGSQTVNSALMGEARKVVSL
ncbi:MAG: hypothetical protein DPW12_00940 [Rhodocyclaceae bacterium]|jgi:hypothetical protein|nr:hypothetical protein [Rhodocyclaceae bacterium]HNQ58063.1 hypothetical protein [Candidatus Desulfobacillus denitrificans]HNT62980.1 hypothetical protein [Candidatus Desulfobacillus denitrificans]